ncbi:MAG TPA: polymer-forming cytoskeletal protein [Nannocystis exedens]|nr:polymer-forming cytoskeletal protein [Nannocystis exedens]
MATRQQSSKLPIDGKTTSIGPEIQVVGRIEGREDLSVQGYVEGSIHLTESLLIDKGGIVVADVRALDVIVHGIVVGDIVADRRIVLQAGARVVGDLKAPRISVAGGAAFRGQVMMGTASDDGEHEESGHRSGSGRWRSGGGSSRAARGTSRSRASSRVARVSRSSAAKSTGVLARPSRALEVEEPGPRHPPLRKRTRRDNDRDREQEIGREASIDNAPKQVAIESLGPEGPEHGAESGLIDVDDGVIGAGGAKKRAARPRVPARGKHNVDHA